MDELLEKTSRREPDSYAPEHAVLWRLFWRKDEEALKEGTELIQRIMQEKKNYGDDDIPLLEVMGLIAEEAGDAALQQKCEQLLESVSTGGNRQEAV